MQGTLKTVLGDIGGGKTAPCYLIYGDEEYLVDDALSKIIGAILPPGQRDLNLFRIDGGDEDPDSISSSILTPPLIPGSKVVLIKNTRLFYSKVSSTDIIKEITSNIEKKPGRAARAFISFLKIAGWTIEDMKDGQWKKISDAEWRSATGTDREKWLPRVIDLCVSLRITGGTALQDTERLEQVLKSGLPDGNCLIITAATVDKRKKLFKIMSDVGTILSFSKSKNESTQRGLMMDTVRDTLAKRGKRLAPDALLALGDLTGLNLRDALKGVEKVIAYVGDRKTIDKNDIDAVVTKTSEDSVFDLTSAIVDKNTLNALQTLQQLFDQGVNHLLILAMITREIRLLLQGKMLLESGRPPSFRPGMDYRSFQATIYPAVKSLADKYGGKSKWLAHQHPYVIYKTLKNSGRFSGDELIGYMKRLADLDLAMKSSGIDPQLALKRLLIDVCWRG
ncbi:MAG: DNA polymerase III subunit delta [Thermodesulfobacteriota bacterium]|nr:DNA polymerase III subunit delta [Thermodesulfobacteriota bacterium]